jgi:putative tryptophan/tyrosine transport system substrate-binding protein
VKRRAFIAGLGGAVAWPGVARAQQQAMPVIGFLSSLTSADGPRTIDAFKLGLNAEGFIEPANVAIERRFAEGDYERLPALADDLVRGQVAVIAAISGTPAALAAKSATATTPIVFAIGSDPVGFGLVTNLNRPDRNVTGVTFFTASLGPKRVGWLRELLPEAKTIALLVDLDNPASAADSANVEAAAHAVGLKAEVVNVSNGGDIGNAFESFATNRPNVLYVGPDPLFFNERDQVAALAARHAIPAIYGDREIVEAGGLMSYGASRKDAYRQAGSYVGRILKGAQPSDLPVVFPTKFELVINLKAAKALGRLVPPTLLATADTVIE